MLAQPPDRFDPIAAPALTMSVGVGCESWMKGWTKGGTYFIEVKGERYECTGGDSWCPDPRAIQVAYDPARPAHCRAAHNLGKLSRWELATLLVSLSVIALALAVLLVRADDQKKRSNAFGHVMLVLSLVLLIYAWPAGLLDLR
jgi:hypothetical protein